MEDLYFKQGTTQNYYVGVTGGTADVTYSVSGRLEDRTGTQPKDGSTNYNLRGGLQASLGEDLTLEFSGSYVRHNFDRLYNGAAIADPLTNLRSRRRPLLLRGGVPAGSAGHLPPARHNRVGQPLHLLQRRALERPATT